MATVFLVATALLAAGAPAAASPVWPASASLRFEPAEPVCLESPSEREARCTAPANQRMEAALEAALHRLFAAPALDGTADLAVTVTGLRGDFEDRGRPAVTLTAWVYFALPGGGALDELEVYGTAMVIETVDNAVSRAAVDLGRGLEARVRDSEAIARWLQGSRPIELQTAKIAPPRGFTLLALDTGLGIVGGAAAASVRAGVSWRWAFVQLSYGSWSAGFENGQFGAGNVAVHAVGLDLGAVLRAGRSWEYRAGAGLRDAWGAGTSGLSGPQPGSFSRKLPTVFASAQYSFWPGWWKGTSRLRTGLELRADFDDLAVFDPTRSTAHVSGPSLALFVGIEFSLTPAPTGAL